MPTIRIEFGFDEVTAKLARRYLDILSREHGVHMPPDVLSELEAEVANGTTVEGSVATLIGNLAAQAAAAAPDNARLQTVLATMQANDARLAALVVSNTPIASPAPVIPAPAPAATVTAAAQAIKAAAAPAPKPQAQATQATNAAKA